MLTQSNKIEDLFSVSEKVVLITGAGGLGSAYAEAFAENGAKVVLASRTVSKAETEAKILADRGLLITAAALDVTDKKQVKAFAADLQQRFGRIDVLIHTAASCKLHPGLEDCEETFRFNMNTNLMGSYFLNQAIGNIMATQPTGGSIININTQSAFSVNSPDGMSYAVSKAALMHLTKYFAVLYAEKGVTVNGIAPIWIDTPMMSGRSQDYLNKAISQVPMGRMSHVEDYVGMGLFLAGAGSRFITGQTFLVDGGWSVSRVFRFNP